MRMAKGWFVSFEGIDGTGKTSQIEMAKDFFSAHGFATVATREPGGTALGRQIRELLLDQKSVGMGEETELLLYGADRSQHVAEVIRPALEKGIVVLSDRYADSTTAYQGYGRGLDLTLIDKINAIATGGLWPALTFILDMEETAALQRIAKNRDGAFDRMEGENRAFFQRVRQGFLTIAAKEPQRLQVIPADRSRAEVFSEIEVHLMRMIGA